METQQSRITIEDATVDIPVSVREKAKNGNGNYSRTNGGYEKPKRIPASSGAVEHERLWATLPHVLGALMFFGLIFSDGMGWLGLMFITGGIYLYYADRSPVIKAQARQALAAQLLGTVGWLTLVLLGAAVWVVALLISALLILVLVGLVLLPLVAIAFPVFVLASLFIPFSAMVISAVAAYRTWQGRTYRYPYIADWLDEHVGAVPTVTIV